jgi:hypothetical protein
MSQAREKLDKFVVPHDKTTGDRKILSDEEKAEAYTAFVKLVDDIYLAHLDFLEMRDSAVFDMSFSWIELGLQEKDGSSLEVTVERRSVEDHSDIPYVSIIESTKDGKAFSHIYMGSLDGIEVQRIDRNMQKEEALSVHDSVDEGEDLHAPLRSALQFARTALEGILNTDLEAQMGLNKLPVGPEEISELRELLITLPPIK